MRTPRSTLQKYLFAISAVLAGTSISAQEPKPTTVWPPVPSILHLPSEYGTLHIDINEYVHESTLRINNQSTNPEIQGLLNITYVFQMPDAQAALISINKGNDTCSFSYRWVILHRDSQQISPEFGSCSDKIRVSTSGKALIVETPNQVDEAKIDVYSYDGGSAISHKTIDP